jgi:hypothetical protein
MVYGAAVTTGGIALACAAVAWGRLEHPTAKALPVSLSPDAILGIALPLLLIGAFFAMTRLARRLTELSINSPASSNHEAAGEAHPQQPPAI